MRRILIDRARRRKAIKHGGDLKREPLDSIVVPAAPDRSEQLLALRQAQRVAFEHLLSEEQVRRLWAMKNARRRHHGLEEEVPPNAEMLLDDAPDASAQ